MKKTYHKIKNHPKTQKVLKHKTFQKYEKWLLLLVWAGAIYFLSSRQLGFIQVVDSWEILIRKLAHVFEFGVLTFFIFRILKSTEKRHIYWNILWAFIFTVLYAISDEYHQSMVPGRFGTYKDVLIDSLGVIVASWLIYLHYHHEKLRKLKYAPKQKTDI